MRILMKEFASVYAGQKNLHNQNARIGLTFTPSWWSGVLLYTHLVAVMLHRILRRVGKIPEGLLCRDLGGNTQGGSLL